MPAIKNVEIFSVGTWNGFKFTDEDLIQIANTTNALITQQKQKTPQLKIGHSTNQILQGQEDGDPSLGMIQNFRVVDRKIIADFEQIPDILFSALEKGLWKQVSVEMKHIETVGWTITAVAILGSDIPAVKNLSNLQAFLKEIVNAPVKNPVLAGAFAFSEPMLILDKEQQLYLNNKMHEEKMSEEKNKALLEELALLKKEKAELELKNLSFAEKEKEIQFHAKKESILAPFAQDVKDGKMAPVFFEKLKAHLESQKVNFSASNHLSVSTDLMRELAQAYSQKLPQGETAGDSVNSPKDEKVTPDIKLSEEIHKVMATSAKGYLEAQHLVFASNPELMKSYHKFNADYHAGRA